MYNYFNFDLLDSILTSLIKLTIVSILIEFILTSRISSALLLLDSNASLISLSPFPLIKLRDRFNYCRVTLTFNASAINEHPLTLILLPSKLRLISDWLPLSYCENYLAPPTPKWQLLKSKCLRLERVWSPSKELCQVLLGVRSFSKWIFSGIAKLPILSVVKFGAIL